MHALLPSWLGAESPTRRSWKTANWIPRTIAGDGQKCDTGEDNRSLYAEATSV